MSEAVELNWFLRSFAELGIEELYSLLQKRQEVFVVEQDCPYLDLDGRDQQSHHLLGYNSDGELLAYARLVAPGVIYPEVSIGRVLTTEKGRGKGLGYRLMEESISAVGQLYGRVPIRISAQSHLQGFYESLEFETTGKNYLEDGIPHTEMLRKASDSSNESFIE